MKPIFQTLRFFLPKRGHELRNRILKLKAARASLKKRTIALEAENRQLRAVRDKLEATIKIRQDGASQQWFLVTAFKGPRHPGLSIQRTWSADMPLPDFLILPCGNHKAISHTDRLVATLSDEIRAGVAAGSVGIVFDGSMEGQPHDPATTARLDRWLAQLGASPRRAIYLTQDRAYERDYRTYCAETGVDQPMAVTYHDHWIWAFADQFAESGADLFEERLAAFRARPPHRSRRFISLNFTPRPTKVLFLLSLMRDGLWDRAFINFGGLDENSKVVGKGKANLVRRMAALPGFADLTAELAEWLPQLNDYGRVLISPVETSPQYGASWFSVVTETEMLSRPCRITEKALMPLVNFHPFVIFGNPESLKAIEALGFATFPELIDEAYDQELPVRARFDLAYQQVKRLCCLDEVELGRLEAKLAERLVHNARWGLTKLPHEARERAHWALLDAITRAVGHPRARSATWLELSPPRPAATQLAQIARDAVPPPPS